MKSRNLNAPDLTKYPPRSPRVRLGGYVILPRCLDKGRAALAKKNGEYHFNCPVDQQFLTFAGINVGALTKQLAAGKSDGEILEWITAHSTTKPAAWEIESWSAHQSKRGPTNVKSREFFINTLSQIGKNREDITTWFDLLDLDDYVTFGGTA